MLNEAGIDRVYLACGATDLRKSIDGLAVLVKEGFELDPFSSCLFVFCNRFFHHHHKPPGTALAARRPPVLNLYLSSKRDILHADETTLQVLQEPGREATAKSYLWLYRTGRGGPSIVLYDYQTTRAGKHPCRFVLDEFLT